jgi:hypothetical protein
MFRDAWGGPVQRFDLAMLGLPADLALLITAAFRDHDAGATVATRQSRWTALRRFARFIVEDGAIATASALDTAAIGRFIDWLGRRRSAAGRAWSPSTAGTVFALVRPLLLHAKRNRLGKLPDDLEIPYNAFPARRACQEPRARLSEAHLKAILAECYVEIDAA